MKFPTRDMESENVLSRTVAIDEAWVRSYEPELKRQSVVAYSKLTAARKFRRVQSKMKMLMVFAYDIRGVLTTHEVPAGEKVNDEYY